MRSLIIAVAACCTSSGALAQQHILIKPEAERVIVEYQFDTPTAGFTFNIPPQPEAQLSSAEVDVAVSAAGVSAPTPRDHFALILTPDRRRTDATYPVLTRLGDGWMIYLPALLARPPAELAGGGLAVSQGWTLQAGPADDQLDGFIYLSATEGLESNDGVISDPSMPSWLVEDVHSAVKVSNDYYGARLKLASPVAPVVLISPLPREDRSFYVGDVTPNGIINLQFALKAIPPERDLRFTDMVQPFVAHEVFHIWQGGKLRTIDGVNERWLNEGAAEYFSLVAQTSISPEAAMRSRKIMAGRLASCISKIENDKTGLLALSGPAAERTRYDCGAVVQWLLDIENTDSDGAWGVWRGLLTAQTGYSVADFIAAADADSSIGLTSLLRSGQDVRATTLSALQGHADEVDPAPSSWASAAFWPLLESNCKGSKGIMTTDDGQSILDTGDRCGALSGDPEVLGIGEHMFADAGGQAYGVVAAACASGDELKVVLKVNGEIRQADVRCTRLASPPAPNYQVLRLR